MLAGILLRLVVAMVEHVPTAPLLVLPLIALFLVARGLMPALASLVVLAAGALLAWALGLVQPMPPPGLSTISIVTPAWDVATLVGLGVPLYLVTMASQNLPGFAVLRASGYQPPTQPILAATGAVSLGTAFLGAHTSNLAAISAALCTGRDAHPDPAKRWMTGPFYAFFWALIALFGASLVGLFGALPPALLATVAGTALLGSLAGAMGTALAHDKDRLAAAGTLAVTASGVTLMGVGSAFWGLCFGLLVFGIEPPAEALARSHENVCRAARPASGTVLSRTRRERSMTRYIITALAFALMAAGPAAVQAQAPVTPSAQAPVREITQDRGRDLSLPQQRPLLGLRRDAGRHHRHRSDQCRAGDLAQGRAEEALAGPVDQVRGLSHDHADHSSGGEVWADTATVVAHENAKVVIIGEKRPTAVPQVTFSDSATIELGGTVVELHYVGAQPLQQFAGDALSQGAGGLRGRLHPGERRVASATSPTPISTSGSNSLRRVEAMEFDILAPGHGPLGTKADVTAFRGYLEDLRAQVLAAARAGKSLEDTKKSVDLSKYKDWGGYEQMGQLNIEGMYRLVQANRRGN